MRWRLLEPSTQLGRNIRAARQAAGLSQQQLADMIFYTQSHISHVERGAVRPGAEMLRMLAQVLGVSAEDLKGGDERSTSTTQKR